MKLDQKLTIEKFLDFQHQLQREILTLEFMRKHPDEEGKISEADFAELLLAYAGYPQKKKIKKIKSVKKRFESLKRSLRLDAKRSVTGSEITVWEFPRRII